MSQIPTTPPQMHPMLELSLRELFEKRMDDHRKKLDLQLRLIAFVLAVGGIILAVNTWDARGELRTVEEKTRSILASVEGRSSSVESDLKASEEKLKNFNDKHKEIVQTSTRLGEQLTISQASLARVQAAVDQLSQLEDLNAQITKIKVNQSKAFTELQNEIRDRGQLTLPISGGHAEYIR